MTMTTAQTIYPVSSRLSIDRRLSNQRIYPDYKTLAITQQDGHTIMPDLICLTTPSPEKLPAQNVSPERLSLLISLQVTYMSFPSNESDSVDHASRSTPRPNNCQPSKEAGQRYRPGLQERYANLE